MPTNPLRDLLTPGEAARVLGASVDSVRRWANEGLLPYTRTPGGQRRFPRKELEALAEAWGVSEPVA